MAKIIARVVSQQGDCSFGHKTGDGYELGTGTPGGVCSWAFHAIFPAWQVLEFGGTFPWESDPDSTTIACPDAQNPVVFELKRTS